jgi:predicted CxxxxCH...CXXCH cytochrome family protein
MKKYLFYIISLTFLAVILQSCSDLKNNITPPPANLQVHKQGILDKNSPNFHGKLVINTNWDMSSCWQCHDRQYTGGLTGVSCLSCHTESNGPEACNTCHGNFNDPAHIAPPRDTKGNIVTIYPGVGAHTSHLYTDTLSSSVSCIDCHVVPDSVYASGHLNAQNVVNFDSLAIHNNATDAEYNPSDNTCANTYCHGNMTIYKDSVDIQYQYAFIGDQMNGNNKTVKWTDVNGTEAKCGSCHDLPPAGHIYVAIKDCKSCHVGVIDENGKIIDKSKHINGEVDLY